MMIRKHTFGQSILFLVLTMALAAHGLGASLPDEVQRQVEIIKSSIHPATDIDLREFEGLSTDNFNGQIGPGIREAFAAALHAAGLVINKNADHVLRGEYFVTDRNSLASDKPVRLTIKVGLTKRTGEEPLELLPIRADLSAEHFANITDTKDLARAFGFTGRLTPDPSDDVQISKAQRQQQMRQHVLNPAPVINGTRIRASRDSEYEVEILVKPSFGSGLAQARRPHDDSGLIFVEIGANELYEIKLYNHSKREVATAITVDGLDVFHFADSQHRGQDGRPTFSHFIVPPFGATGEGTTTVVGWFQKLAPPNNYLSFMVTEFGRGAVSRAGIKARSQVGAIHVQFAHCRALAEHESSRGGNETGLGPPRSIQQRAEKFEIKPPHEFVTIRYTRSQE